MCALNQSDVDFDAEEEPKEDSNTNKPDLVFVLIGKL